MQRTILGVLLATVVLYFFGFAYWGASGIPYQAWNETADDRAAGAALREHFPESGVYFIPANGNPPEERTKLYDTGPTGFVILDVDGRPEFDVGIMMTGFLLNGVVMVLFALILRMARPATPAYSDRLKLCVLIAALAVVMINLGDAVWWVMPLPWELAQAFYNFAALVIGGAILAKFCDEEPSVA